MLLFIAKYIINEEQSLLQTIQFILFIIILVVCLIYTEVIVINIFSLGDYTKSEIDKRGLSETKRMENQMSIKDFEIEEIIEEEIF